MKHEFDGKWKFLRQILAVKSVRRTNVISFHKKGIFKRKKMKKKEEDWQSKKKENLEKVGKIIFWFTGHFLVFLYGQIEPMTPSSYH